MTRDQAFELLKQHMKDPANLNHSHEAEVIMRALAKHLGEDAEYWGSLGLLHDIDWEYGEDLHCNKCREILAEAGFDQEFIDTIVSHGYGSTAYEGKLMDEKRTTKVQHALAAGETITGLIYAVALVRPDKKLGEVEVKSVKKKMKDKAFAAKVNRDIIKECKLIGLELDEFIDVALKAMKEIAPEIGI